MFNLSVYCRLTFALPAAPDIHVVTSMTKRVKSNHPGFTLLSHMCTEMTGPGGAGGGSLHFAHFPLFRTFSNRMLFRKNMPESLWKPSFPPAMDSLQFEIIPEESSSELEDEDDLSLLALPEICIPPPLFTPLPLQCLAASALPDGVKREIESVTASVADLRGSSVFSQSSSEVCSWLVAPHY